MPLSTSENLFPALRFSFILVAAISIAAIGLANPNDVMRSRRLFKRWYPQFAERFSQITEQNCTHEYSIYIYGTRQNTTASSASGADVNTLFVQPMIDCILRNTSEYIKYQLGSSQVILGLTPTIIALLGASSEEVCLLALIGKRRLLGLCLAAASPSIYTERAFKYQDPDRILKETGHEEHVKGAMHIRFRWIFVILEYLVALASITNVVNLSWELGTRSVTTVNANTTYLPILWSVLGIATHIAGAVVFGMRARRLDEEGEILRRTTSPSSYESFKALRKHGVKYVVQRMLKGCRNICVREFCLKRETDEGKLYFHLISESRCFILLAWSHSVLTIFHIILGTLILSGVNFVGPRDALGVMCRFILSAITCRMILLYELAVLRLEYKNTYPDDHVNHAGARYTQVQVVASK